MRLTVGPLPAAVYWRRRAVVLVGFALVVLVVTYACNGESTAGNAQPDQSPTETSSPPSPTTTLQRPTIESPQPTTQPAFTLPVAGDAGSCSEAELEVVATAASAEIPRGQAIDVTIKIKNVSGRSCSRDVGADVQELRLVADTKIVWSSDDCNPNTGHDVRSFAAGQEITFTRRWAGKRSRSGDGSVNCGLDSPEFGVYQLVARLDNKLSEPFALLVRST